MGNSLKVVSIINLLGMVTGIFVCAFFLLLTSVFFIYPLASLGVCSLSFCGVVLRRYGWLFAGLNIAFLQIGPMLSLWSPRLARSYEFPIHLVSRVLWG